MSAHKKTPRHRGVVMRLMHEAIPITTPPTSQLTRISQKQPQGDSNPCLQAENLTSWAGLDDGARRNLTRPATGIMLSCTIRFSQRQVDSRLPNIIAASVGTPTHQNLWCGGVPNGATWERACQADEIRWDS